jgi:hypothetical protein
MSPYSCPGNPGDLVIFKRPLGYKHYAVNVGKGYIVHVTAPEDVTSAGAVSASGSLCCSSNFDLAVIKKERYSDLVRPNDRVVVEDDTVTWKGKSALPAFEIIKRALSKIGERGYNLLLQNCEHFARWCRYGEEKSDQADLGIAAGLFVVGAVAVGAVAVAYAALNNSGKEEETDLETATE